MLVANGYRPLPLHQGKKNPIPIGWPSYCLRNGDDRKYATASTGILTGDVVGIDIDVLTEALAGRVAEIVVQQLGAAPMRTGRWPKRLFIYRTETPFTKKSTRSYRLTTDAADAKSHRVEVLAKGQQFVAFGVHPETGAPYEWSGGDPLSVSAGELIVVTESQCDALIEELDSLLAQHGEPAGKFRSEDGRREHITNENLRGDPELVIDALAAIRNDDLSYDDWVYIGLAIKGALGDEGYAAWGTFSEKSKKYDVTFTTKTWSTLRTMRIGAGTIFHLARTYGWRGDTTAAKPGDLNYVYLLNRRPPPIMSELNSPGPERPADVSMYPAMEADRSIIDPIGAAPTLVSHTTIECGPQKDALQVPAEDAHVLSALNDLNSQYAWVRRQKRIYRFRYSDFIETSELRTELANRPKLKLANASRAVTAAECWLCWPERRGYDDVVYEPGLPQIFENKINLWPGWGCEAVAGDVGPWRELLDEAFSAGSPIRQYVEQWMAIQIQKPGIKLFAAVVLWNPLQGIGKTLIGESCAKLFGKNAVVITSEVIRGSFNDWSKRKQFVLGEETMNQDARGGMDSLKHLITGETITVNEKYQPIVILRNTINFMFTSNHSNAVHIDINDRRFLVVRFVGKKRDAEFYSNFVKWRDEQGGLRALMHHLKHLPLDGFDPKAPPPITKAKEDMMEASFTAIERWLREQYIDSQAVLSSEVVYVDDLVINYRSQKDQSANSTSMGLALARVGNCETKRVRTATGRKTLHSIRRHEYWTSADPQDWAAEYEKGRLIGTQVATAAQFVPATVPQSGHSLH